MEKKCTKINNARAQPLYCPLSKLLGCVLVAVAVALVVSLSSLILNGGYFCSFHAAGGLVSQLGSELDSIYF